MNYPENMDFSMPEIQSYNLQVTVIQAGQDLWMTGSPLHRICSILDQMPYHGSARSRTQFHCHQQKQSTRRLVQGRKQFGLGGYFII